MTLVTSMQDKGVHGKAERCGVDSLPAEATADDKVVDLTSNNPRKTASKKKRRRPSSLLKKATRNAGRLAKNPQFEDFEHEDDEWVDIEDDGGRDEPTAWIEPDDAEAFIELDIEGRAVEYPVDSSPPNTTLIGDALRQAYGDFFGLRFQYHRFT